MRERVKLILETLDSDQGEYFGMNILKFVSTHAPTSLLRFLYLFTLYGLLISRQSSSGISLPI